MAPITPNHTRNEPEPLTLRDVREEISAWLRTDDCDALAFLIRLSEKLDAELGIFDEGVDD